MENNDAMTRVISLAGGQSALAQKLTDILRAQGKLAQEKKISQGHIWYWIKTKRVPIKYVPAMAEAVENQVTKHELCPDFFSTEAA